ncbi:beta-ketoacyl [acyl carrier protein] synthase domain-containing protein, partial [Nisaea nitritireducens]|uniref:beta-ketoacyl [acyl carrier protein] synthase domain-containing protein n=1 Tax=Nisaea nitritireducens TaxID=568392 RepID=UPI001D00E8D2
MLTPGPILGMRAAGMLSPDGTCRAFAEDANGTVAGEAVAALVLKRQSRAEADGDPIHGLILGSALNYDGKTNGITAPSRIAQRDLISGLYADCGIDRREIGHIVTHGTGTRLGDPVEINALCDAFRDSGAAPGQCALTSVKSNLGHSFAASGVVSLIALVQSLRHGTLPASLHCARESGYIRWQDSPFYVNRETRPWPLNHANRRVGAVSAFGMSGTNAHVVAASYEGPPAASA